MQIDYIYRDELEQAARDGVLTRYVTAFSRESDRKVYVQDRMLADGADIWALLSSNTAYLYVCGATGMGKGVRDAVVQIAQTHGGLGPADAAAFVQKLQASGQYIQELWSM